MIQPYQGLKDGFSIPWKKSKPENFKNAMDLLVADGGGIWNNMIAACHGIVFILSRKPIFHIFLSDCQQKSEIQTIFF